MTVPAILGELFADARLSAGRALGKGLWRARREEDGVEVVVKIWPVPVGVDPLMRMRLQDEAVRSLGAATPHVYLRRLVAGHVASVMRWEVGAAPAVPMNPSAPDFRALLEAVARLHRAQLVHRDLCPRNVLVCPDGRLLLLDLEDVVRSGHIADLVGTAGFLAPEVEAGQPCSTAADVYALGRFLDPDDRSIVASLARCPTVPWRAQTADELRAALPIPIDAPPFRGRLHGPEALHDVVGQAHRLRALVDGQRWLDRLCAAGFGRPDERGGRVLHPTDLHRWQALCDGAPTLAAAWTAIEEGAPGRAVWRLLSDGMEGHGASETWLDVLCLATIETHDPSMLRYVRVFLEGGPPDAAVAAEWCRDLIGAALRGRGAGVHAVLAGVKTMSVPNRGVARRAYSMVLFRVALAAGSVDARAVLDELLAQSDFEDVDRAARLQAWAGLLAYRMGQYAAASDALERAWPRRQFAHGAALTASNLVAVWLHLDRPDRAEAVARSALQRLPPGAHPYAAARLAAKLREAVYRAHAAPQPDLPVLDAISVASPPVGVALATLNEAAAAWRSGSVATSARLAHDAALLFEDTGILGGYLLAAALACRTGHPAWWQASDRLEATVDRILDESGGPCLPAVAAQVLGILATDADDPLAVDARALAVESGRPMAPRREVLSLTEAACAARGLPGR